MSARDTPLPAGHRLRRPRDSDAEVVTAIKQAVDIARHGDSDVTLDDLRAEWALPRLDRERDLWLVENGTGGIVAYGSCWIESPPRAVVADQIVDPAHRGLGLSELLLDLGEARAAEMARAVPDGRPVALGVFTHETDTERVDLFAQHGFRKTRTFLRLYRDLAEPVESVEWPAGITVRSIRRGLDDAAVHAASDEAFRDHFRPTTWDLDEWLECLSARSDVDPGLWFVAWAGDQVAGSVFATRTPGGGYIDELSVRRPWRGRGLGRALLLHEAAELRRRGVPRAYLGVDGANPTGAMRLYRSVGFEPQRGAEHFFEKDVSASCAPPLVYTRPASPCTRAGGKMPVIEAEHLSKRFGKKVLAVDDVSFALESGTITGMLGPNGAGKTTTLRMILDLVRPTSGYVAVLGSRYRDLHVPAGRVGALLDASGFHPGRSGRNALSVIATGAHLPPQRVDEVLDLVELTASSQRAVKGYSMGMRQRLALAAALLGDPEILILDEPGNGLDPEGMLWLRTFLRRQAAEGRTVLIASHVLAEVEQTVDDVLIMSEGRLLAQGPISKLTAGAQPVVRVRTPAAEKLEAALHSAGAAVNRLNDALAVRGPSAAEVGEIAQAQGVVLHELLTERPSLEDLFLQIAGTRRET